ncbi:MAG TPA: family 16 glycosylhydrolase [Saprospiraceae bacterium]|nr:family 16 glycosylhydrolase [Saprospiraceae bacterium]
MKQLSLLQPGLLVLAMVVFSPSFLVAQCPTLLWSDEFSGTALDMDNWNFQTGDGCAEGICGWGNNELQSYQQNNVEVSDGTLKITARFENVDGKQYSSGRINTKNKADFTYGRYESSIKLPGARGLWPAFWMLSTNEPYGGWPRSGEIDIMEFVSSKPKEVLGSIHYGDPFPNNQFQTEYLIKENGNFLDTFYNFAVEWEPGVIRFFVDDVLYGVKRASDVAPFRWPFDQDMHFLLNVAVGGSLGGSVVASDLPATMEVDYVRVYDGGKPYLEGDWKVNNREESVAFTIQQLTQGTQVTWTIPEDATIVSGQGTNQIRVDFGDQSGTVSATFNNGCEDQTISNFVTVGPPFARAFSFENFDDPGQATFAFSNGTLTEVANPDPDSINSSTLVGRYARSGGERYDVLIYDVNSISNAGVYLNEEQKLYMDVYTSAPIGTEILLQMETSRSMPNNFPTGRHSRFVTTVTENNQWHRLVFELLDRPDQFASSLDIQNIVLLFNSDSFTSDIYFFDNFDSYSVGSVTNTRQRREISRLRVFPNPVSDLLNFSSPSNSRITFVELFSLQGKQVLRRKIQNQQGQIDISQLERGMYLLKAIDEYGKTYTQKIMK